MGDTPKSDFEMRDSPLSQSQNSEPLMGSVMSNVYSLADFKRSKLKSAPKVENNASIEERVRKIQASVARINQLILELKASNGGAQNA
jgi:hypothetical protein